MVHAARQSFVDGWQQAMWAGVAVAGALFVYLLAHGPKTTTQGATTANEKGTASETLST
ncbi:hypothetical protein [Streptomyces sp. NPDC017964]|uniref:hypothetical protein n=1 Tax=Streptomyces sp. NPDC017964 TaxID=3365022 RepID=UPI0037A2DEC8